MVVLVLLGAAAIWVHDRRTFERRHDGFVRGTGAGPTVIEVLRHRARRLDEFPKECREILLLAHKVGRKPLKRWSDWQRARRDMLRLCASGISKARRLMKNKNQAIGSALQELEIGMGETKALCMSCLEENRKGVADGRRPICFVLDAKEGGQGEGNADGQPKWDGTIDIGPEGELRIHERGEIGQPNA